MQRDTVYTFEIVVDDTQLNDAARNIIPELIREFATQAKVKMACVAATTAVQMKCVVASHVDSYIEKEFPLVQEDT